MPKVGKRHFAYTDTGKKKAYEYAKKTGQKIEKVNKFGKASKRKSY